MFAHGQFRRIRRNAFSHITLVCRGARLPPSPDASSSSSSLPLISFHSFLPLLFAYPPQSPWVVFSHLVSTMRPRPVSVSIMLIHPRACQLNPYLLSGNDAIENQLKRDRMMAKNEIKMLLLGAGESGKVRCDVDP